MPFDEKSVDPERKRAPLPRSERSNRSLRSERSESQERESAPGAASLGLRSPGVMAALQGSAGNDAVVQLMRDGQEQHQHGAGCGHRSPVQRAAADREVRKPAKEVADGVTVQRARYATGPTERDENSDNYDSDADNFDTRYQNNLPQPTPDGNVEELVNQGSSQYVVLWRGTSLSAANAMESAGSAGGASPSRRTAAPSRAASQRQIGGGSSLTEFTAHTGVAESFGSQGAVVVVQISAAYLSRGSRSEEGWTALASAPLQVLDVVDRTRGKKQKRRVANAS